MDLKRTAGLRDELLRKIASRATFRIADARGVRSGQVAVLGYPKSGTSWVAKLVSAALSLPEPSFYRAPILKPAVLHGHVTDIQRVPVAYVVRDPRDVMTSLYHHRARVMKDNRSPRHNDQMRERYACLPAPMNSDNYRENIHGFVEIEFSDPRDSRVPWDEHVRRALVMQKSAGNLEIVRYEDMLVDSEDSLEDLLVSLDFNPGRAMIAGAVETNSFEKLSGGRKAGEADGSSFFRAGEAGRWRKEMPEEAAQAISERFFAEMELFHYGPA